MAANSTEAQYLAVTKLITISTANPNLDGSGTIANLITGSSNGTLLKSILVKALTDTTDGMIRLFVKNSGGVYCLLSEFSVLPIIRSNRDVSFSINIPLNYSLSSGESIGISTENSDSFNVIAEAFDLSYSTSTCFVGSSLELHPNSAVNVVNTSNSSLDGTGTCSKIITASADYAGLILSALAIKAQQSVSPGMVRFFIQDKSSGNLFLFNEVSIPSTIRNEHLSSFQYSVLQNGSYCIAPEFSIWASTENSEFFTIIAEGSDWKNV